jgi:hypothetical protein
MFHECQFPFLVFVAVRQSVSGVEIRCCFAIAIEVFLRQPGLRFVVLLGWNHIEGVL